MQNFSLLKRLGRIAQARPPEARHVGDDRGAAALGRVPAGRGQLRRHPLRARRAHVRRPHAQHARPLGRPVRPADLAPADPRRSRRTGPASARRSCRSRGRRSRSAPTACSSRCTTSRSTRSRTGRRRSCRRCSGSSMDAAARASRRSWGGRCEGAPRPRGRDRRTRRRHRPARAPSFGEIVFNTAMSGYQEVLTDPSYSGQIVVMTAAHVGNYGIRADEAESDRVHVAGLRRPRLPGALERHRRGEEPRGLPGRERACTGLHGLDTRSLVRRIRSEGAMRAGRLDRDRGSRPSCTAACSRSPPMVGSDLALAVSPREGARRAGRPGPQEVPRRRRRLRDEAQHRAPPAGRLLPRRRSSRRRPRPTRSSRASPDGIFLSNGPGDPAALPGPIRTIERLIDDGQADLRHLPRPPAARPRARRDDVQAEVRAPRRQPSRSRTSRPGTSRSRRRTTASPSTPETLPRDVETTHRNLNDGTLEGFRHRDAADPRRAVPSRGGAGPARRQRPVRRASSRRWSRPAKP